MLAGFCSAQECKRADLKEERIKAGDSFTAGIGTDLELRLTPLKNDSGWVVSVTPKDSQEDWTFPVNMPLRTGENQFLGTGYGSSVKDRLDSRIPHHIRFALTADDYKHYATLAAEALSTPRPEAAGEFIQRYKKFRTGLLAVEVMDFDKSGPPEQTKWMKFRVTVTVPITFSGSSDLAWKPAACPARR